MKFLQSWLCLGLGVTVLFCVSCKSTGSDGGGLGLFGKSSEVGEDDNTDEPAVTETAEAPDEVEESTIPMRLPMGSVQMVSNEGFVLVRSSKAFSMPVGTEMMTYSLDGRPTAKLKLSPERKGAYVVADIVQGKPGQGDRVVAMSGKTSSGVIRTPSLGGADDVQVLE